MTVLCESRNGQNYLDNDTHNSETTMEICNPEIKSSKKSSGHSKESETKALMEETLEEQDSDTDTEKHDAVVIEESKALDGGWGWFIILGCLILRMTVGGIGRSHGLFYKRFIERFHQSAMATAWVTSLTNTVRLGTGPVVSIMCNRFTGRSLVFVGASLLSVALIITGFAPSQPFLYFSYGIVGGLGRSFALTPCPLLLGHYFDKRRSLAFGLASAGFSLGGFGITPLVELMFQTYGFTGTFIVLSGISTHIFICACLFRPIELQRRLLRKSCLRKDECEKASDTAKETCDASKSTTKKLRNQVELDRTFCEPEKHSLLAEESHTSENGGEVLSANHIPEDGSKDTCITNVGNSKYKTTKLQHDRDKGGTEVNTKDVRKKKKLISLSIVKDIRFLTFLLALFFNSLPSSGLFLPSLAVSRGLSEFEAAYLLSINAGTDTVFRVVAGLVLDMKVFRNKRPIIYNVMTFLQAAVVFLLPSMWSFASFAVLISLEGMVQGVKNAQRSVIMVDLLGLDKLASSMALSMCAQAAGIMTGPTISGLLKDVYGSYDGAFYFGGSAILAGAFIMAGGNIRKIYADRQEKMLQKDKESEASSLEKSQNNV